MKIYKNNIEELQDILKYTFTNHNLLQTSITHSSFVNQKKETEHNERLEFLGDSVLQLSITEYLYKNYLEKTEGELTRLRALIVCENSLYNIAHRWNLGKYILMSKGEELTGGRQRTSILADCVEAIIAAIYLDSNLETIKEFIYDNFNETIKKAINNEIVLDYKTKLQEMLQQNGDTSILYNLINYEGPPHRRKFYTQVVIDNQIKGTGCGFSKKESEQNAAKEALDLLEVKYEK